MLTFILLGIITVVTIAIGSVIVKSKYRYDLGWLSDCLYGVGICALLTLIIVSCTLININTRFEATQNEYAVICGMVESYDGQDYGNMIALTEKVVEMNSKIAQHKAHYKSFWTSPWFSEDIANLEPITFGKKVRE